MERYTSLYLGIAGPFIYAMSCVIILPSVNADGVGTGTCQRYVNGKWITEPCRSAPSTGRPSQSTGGGNVSPSHNFIPSGPSPRQLEQQRKRDESIKLSNRGVEYDRRGYYDTALEYFERALRVDPDNHTARDNIRIVRAKKAYHQGVEYYENGEFEKALSYFREALRFLPGNRDILAKIDDAKGKADNKKKQVINNQERVRMVNETEERITNLLDKVTSEVLEENKHKNLNIMTISSNTVDLRFIDPNKPLVVDPQKVKGEYPPGEMTLKRQRQAEIGKYYWLSEKYAESGNSEQALQCMKKALTLDPENEKIKKKIEGLTSKLNRSQKKVRSNRRTEMLLNALAEHPGNWEGSIQQLEDTVAKDPTNLPAREALFYLKGLYAGQREESFVAKNRNEKELNEMISSLTEPTVKAKVEQAQKDILQQDYLNALIELHKAQALVPEDIGLRALIHYTEGRLAGEDLTRYFQYKKMIDFLEEDKS